MGTAGRALVASLLASIALVGGCGDGVVASCTTEARSSVTVKVVDAQGAPVTDATVTYSVGGGAAQTCESFPAGADYVCGWEVFGDFTIVVTKGADSKTTSVSVGKTADGCHVQGQSITVTLGG